MMSSFLEKIKLTIFKTLRKPYKNKLFKDNATNLELKFLSNLLEQEPLFFIDVGANKGEFLFTVEKVLAPSKIWAVEPLPYFAKKLKALFPKIKVFNLALSDREAQTTLYVPINNGISDDSLSSISKPAGNFNSYTINCTTLDNLIENNFITNEKIFLKIDVEGHEFNLLQGAEKTIKNSVLVMLIEIEERHHKGKSLKEMIESIESKGFYCYHLNPQKTELVRFSAGSDDFQKKEDLNTRKYINNFWFFAKQFDHISVVSKLNTSM
ncbi:MAG TPA: FkbM family methyltransferase [Bacteroidia bacterium]